MTLMITDNLFFRNDDGSVLAVRISSILGPELLRGLSQPLGHLTVLPALPFALTPSTALGDDLAENTQNLSLATKASTKARSTAPTRSRAASTSIKTSVHLSTLSPKPSATSSTGEFVTEACFDGIFSSTDGNPYDYDRDWIRVHNINKGILEGVPSKHKLDMLFRHHAVLVGDKLCVTYHSSGSPVIKEGEVSVQQRSLTIMVSNLIFPLDPTWLHDQQHIRSYRAPST